MGGVCCCLRSSSRHQQNNTASKHSSKSLNLKWFVKKRPSPVVEPASQQTAADKGEEISHNDEECCPTCFYEYTEEHPKIVMQCSHHYHLQCIYEWMERSQFCPVCRKMMLFDESSFEPKVKPEPVDPSTNGS